MLLRKSKQNLEINKIFSIFFKIFFKKICVLCLKNYNNYACKTNYIQIYYYYY